MVGGIIRRYLSRILGATICSVLLFPVLAYGEDYAYGMKLVNKSTQFKFNIKCNDSAGGGAQFNETVSPGVTTPEMKLSFSQCPSSSFVVTRMMSEEGKRLGYYCYLRWVVSGSIQGYLSSGYCQGPGIYVCGIGQGPSKIRTLYFDDKPC